MAASVASSCASRRNCSRTRHSSAARTRGGNWCPSRSRSISQSGWGRLPTIIVGSGGSRTGMESSCGRPHDCAVVRTLGGVSIAPAPAVPLGDRFARELPELALPWRAEEAPEPRLLVVNEPLVAELGLDPELVRGEDGVRLLVGSSVPAGATPVAQAYAGHQFGGYAPRLGDGRALLLGELVDRHGGLRDLHLKGSGRTPFARGGDGLAAVGPMLREYVV